MKTIGILTFHTADNYGAVLQAYALQHFLSTHYNVKAEIINFSTPLLENEYKIFFLKSPNILKNIFYKIINFLFYSKLKHKKKKFVFFRTKVLYLSEKKYVSPEDLKNNIYPYDIFISGSDQVFNPKINYSDIYYLNFDKKNGKKVAYAPSFGISNFSEEITKRIKPYLDDFDSLSCRESQGAFYLSSIMQRDIPCVIDPVFLLSKKDWLKIAIKPNIKNNYIFVYDLNGGYKLLSLAKKVAESTGLDIYCCTSHITFRYSGVKCLYDLGPQDLLGYIANAEYVVTDSFHGTSLSIIMGTKFLSYIASPATSSRIKSILDILGLKTNIVENIELFEFSKIKWNHDDDALRQIILSSIDYLNKSL